MKLITATLAVFVLLLACSKDKFQTTPQIEIKSIEPGEVFNNNFFTLKAIITDKEGDLRDSIARVEKTYNLAEDTLIKVDTLYYNLADLAFPKKDKIEIEMLYFYGEYDPNRTGTKLHVDLQNKERKFSVGLIMKDEAGNVSEYVESPKIILKPL